MTEYPPGTVAAVTCSDGKERRALFGTHWIDDSGVWLFRDGTRRDAAVSEARPLVVIDPEDREQVERLWRAWTHLAPDHLLAQENMQAALREFANPKPPKPPEPTGLGAVVEDEVGRWTRARTQDHGMNWRAQWGGNWRNWKDFHDDVKVLSEGV